MSPISRPPIVAIPKVARFPRIRATTSTTMITHMVNAPRPQTAKVAHIAEYPHSGAPSRSPKTSAHAIERMRRANHAMNVMTPAARIVKIHVMPLASEKAAPGLRTNCHCSSWPSTGTTSECVMGS